MAGDIPGWSMEITTGYVGVDGGLELYYQRQGNGSPLILLHGTMGTIESCFADLLPILAEHFEAIAVEMQGHGRTRDIDRPHHAYRRVAPDPDAWIGLVTKVNELDRNRFLLPDDRLAALPIPTMLIAGDADIVPPEHVVALFRLLDGGVPGDLVGLPRAQLAVLPGTTHVGVLERITWLSSMILGFLGQAGEQ